jgi:eukaryotic-like serine/threonine-protein kinase
MGCPGENEILEFVEGRAAGEARDGLAAHLDACEACRELVALTARAVLPTASDGPPRKRIDSLPDAGDVIGRYRVLRRLGRGAMGLVLAAEHLELRRRVALKIVLPDADRRDADAQLRARLVREARAASAIRHENVVTVHDVMTLDDGSPVMVMDLLEGETLRARLERDGRLPPAEVTTLARQLGAALGAAHALGVVHRDLKPDNVFLARDGDAVVVKIVDFGIAKLTAVDGPAAETAGLTQTGMLVGTPHYMAPEQAFADGAIDARADLWALGVIVYECLTGARPFEGDNVGQVLRRLARLGYRPVEELAPETPEVLGELVARLLSERDLRPTSAAEVLALLERGPEGGALSSSRGRVARALPLTSVSADGLAVSWLGRVKGERSWLLGLAAAAVAAAVAIIAWPSSEALLARAERAEVEPLGRWTTPAVVVPARALPEPAALRPRVVKAPPRAEPSASALPPAPVAPGPGQLITKPPF